MKKLAVLLCIVIIILCIGLKLRAVHSTAPAQPFWEFTSIDTMKYSRDLSREKLTDPLFDRVIDQQMSDIAGTGASYVSIATPYDDEFLPMLKRWITSARAHNLHVWFRGNWSGWEGWFGYTKIIRSEHMTKTHAFILAHPDLFQDGDVFSACPECENGGPGDPRKTGDISGQRRFLIDEYAVTTEAFHSINKQVRSNFDSMNADVAKVVMDKDTTVALDGIVTIDHYVSNPKDYAADISSIAQNSGGKIIIGEFGAPIPNLHGQMTPEQQAAWIKQTLELFVSQPEVVGVNYWVNVGGTTELWKDGSPLPAVQIIRDAYTVKKVSGRVTDETHTPISTVKVTSDNSLQYTDERGVFSLPHLSAPKEFTFTAPGYMPVSKVIGTSTTPVSIVLKKENESFFFIIKRTILQLFTAI